MTTLYLQNERPCKTPGCWRWVQWDNDASRATMRCPQCAAVLVNIAPDMVARMGTRRVLESDPATLDRIADEAAAANLTDELNADIQTPQPVSEDEHNRKVQRRRLAEAQEEEGEIPERF